MFSGKHSMMNLFLIISKKKKRQKKNGISLQYF